MKLLIAEDELIVRKGLRSLDWESRGIKKILEAKNGSVAKEYLEKEEIDIVISDIKMPELNGLELCEYVKGNGLDTIVILLTGYSSFEYARKAIHNKVFDYLLKPVKTNELMNTVDLAIEIINERKKNKQIIYTHTQLSDDSSITEQTIHFFVNANQKVKDMLIFISTNYMNDISLSLLAEKYHFSTNYLSRLIKRETEFSFTEILLAIRLLKAAKILQNKDKKIYEICEKVGIHDQRYFSQIFKRIFLQTPLEFKKKDNKCYTLEKILNNLKQEKRIDD